jgi:ABC-type branched-subunit amino acid transport system substrate-binding protein
VAYASRLTQRADLAGVVFHQGSRESLLLAPMFREAQVPLLLTSATSRRLRETGPWTFMLAPDDSAEGAFIGSFAAARLGAHSATLFYVVDEYGTGLRDGVMSALRERGVAVLDAVGDQYLVKITRLGG